MFGVQGDWTNVTATATDNFFAATTDQTKIKGIASVTGRAGYAWDRFLGYVKGGGAWESDQYSITSPVVLARIVRIAAALIAGIGVGQDEGHLIGLKRAQGRGAGREHAGGVVHYRSHRHRSLELLQLLIAIGSEERSRRGPEGVRGLLQKRLSCLTLARWIL